MDQSRNAEQLKPKLSSLKKVARGALVAGAVLSPIGAGHAFVEPTKDFNRAVEGIHRSFSGAIDPVTTGAELVGQANNVGLGVMEGIAQVVDTWPPWSSGNKDQQQVIVEPIKLDIIVSEYGQITPDQRDLINIAIANEVDNLNSAMTDADWDSVRKYAPLIRGIGVAHGLDEDFLGMVVQESHGDPYAESPVGAAGFAQLMPDFAEHFALKVVRDNDPRIQGMSKNEIKTFRIANDERYNPQKNLEAAATSISENIEKFKNKKIGYLVHHQGDAPVWGAVQKFVYDKYGYRLADVLNVNIGSDDANYNEALRRLKEYQDTIEGKNPFLQGEVAKPIGLVDLISTGEFTGEGSDFGDRYMYLIDAAKLSVKKRGI